MRLDLYNQADNNMIRHQYSQKDSNCMLNSPYIHKQKEYRVHRHNQYLLQDYN